MDYTPASGDMSTSTTPEHEHEHEHEPGSAPIRCVRPCARAPPKGALMLKRFSGAHLRGIRTAAGLRREALAHLVGRSVYSINDYEAGRSLPSVPTLCALASALGCRLDDLCEVDSR